MQQPGVPGVLTNTSFLLASDGYIDSIRATNIIQGASQVTAAIVAGGPGHREVTLLFFSPVLGQIVDFRVEIFAGVAMIKASMLFMTIALAISYLLK